MSKEQKAVLVLVALFYLLMLLFPPFVIQYGTEATFNEGYRFILIPPDDGMAIVNSNR